ncbi:MAG: PAS domain S-box protein [Acidobacteria bacterium]|nr:PAS domain S-box protein [Acidobacteriota bacterium]
MDVLFQALVEHSADAVVLVSADGIVGYASASVADLLGYAPAERTGRSAFDHVHPEDEPRARALLAEVLRRPDTPIPAEYRVQHRDGSWRAIEAIAVNRLAEPQIGAIVITYRDIGARRRAEDALRASEERLRHIVEHAQDLIYYCSPEGRFTYVNPAAARVMKYDESELIGRHFLSLIRPDHHVAAGEHYARQILDGVPATYFEFPAITRTGETVWIGQHVQLVYEHGCVVAIHAIARDITRQKTAEEELRRSEARYRSLIQGAALGIYRASLDGTILDANPALAGMLGYDSVDDLMAHGMREVYANAAERAALIEHHRAHGSDTVSTDVQWRRKDQRLIMVRLTARGVAADQGPISVFEGIAEDVTERRVLEERLREAQKMEAIGRLARGVAHDFNNVLAAIMGSADLILTQRPEGDPSHEEAQAIVRAADRGAALTRQLLAFSRRQALQPEVLDFHGVVRGMEDMLVRLTGDVTLRLRTSGEPPQVRLEPGQIEQVLLNLVVNARDAIGDRGGTIDVAADTVELGERRTRDHQGLPPGAYARLTVRDTGPGIAPDAQPYAFEPFFTTKGPAKGTGLGLSIVYGIAKEAGGSVTFTTSAQGTTFEVLFPKLPAPPTA